MKPIEQKPTEKRWKARMKQVRYHMTETAKIPPHPSISKKNGDRRLASQQFGHDLEDGDRRLGNFERRCGRRRRSFSLMVELKNQRDRS
jgi:hypothetical protein